MLNLWRCGIQIYERRRKTQAGEGGKKILAVNTVLQAFIYIYHSFFLSMKQAWALQINDTVKDFTRREN